MRDFKRLQEDPPAGVSGAPGENNIMLWNAVIFGPQETPFEDGTFKLTLEFSEEYPNKPPVVKFLSKVRGWCWCCGGLVVICCSGVWWLWLLWW